MSKDVLVLLSHPYLHASNSHKNISTHLANIPGVTVRHIDEVALTSGHFDSKVERKFWQSAGTIILEFPLYWYHSPALLKQYLDDVLTDDWAYESNYDLAGKNLQVLTTTGGIEELYSASGEHGFKLSEILTPYKAIASFTKMNYLPELAIYAANYLSESELQSEIDQIAARISDLTKD